MPTSFADEFRGFLENELIDTSMSVSLQEAARLNWWTCLGEGCERLWPLSTTGDGNCLLHAASLGRIVLKFKPRINLECVYRRYVGLS